MGGRRTERIRWREGRSKGGTELEVIGRGGGEEGAGRRGERGGGRGGGVVGRRSSS